jgi:hypothetical protein
LIVTTGLNAEQICCFFKFINRSRYGMCMYITENHENNHVVVTLWTLTLRTILHQWWTILYISLNMKFLLKYVDTKHAFFVF